MREYFEDCHVGDQYVTPARTITETDVVMFAAFTGDWNPIHTDAVFAGQTEFGERIAHGLLTLVVGTGLLFRAGGEEFYPRNLIALASLDRLRYVAPVKFGDTIRLESEIVELITMGPEKGLIAFKLRVKNQRDATVLTGILKGLVKRRPSAA